MPIKDFNYRRSLFGNYNQQSPLNRYDKGIPRYNKGYSNFMKDCLTLTLGTYGKNKSPKEAYDEAKAILKGTKAQDGKRDETKLLGFFKKAMKVQNQVGINQMVAQAVKRSRQIKKGMIDYDERAVADGGRPHNKWHIINPTIAEGEKDNYGDDGGLIFQPHAYEGGITSPLWDSLSYSVQFSFDKGRQIASTRNNDFFEKLFSGAALDELTYTDLFKTPENRLPQDFQIYMTVFPTLEYKLWSDYTGDTIHDNRQKLAVATTDSNGNITRYDLAETTIEAWENTEGRRTQGIQYDLEIKAPTQIEGVPWLYTFSVNLSDNTITWQIKYDGKRENVSDGVISRKNIIKSPRSMMEQFMDSLFDEKDHEFAVKEYFSTSPRKVEVISPKSQKEKYESVIKLFSDYGIEPPMYILANRNDVGIINHPFF